MFKFSIWTGKQKPANYAGNHFCSIVFSVITNFRFFRIILITSLANEYKQAALGTAMTIPNTPNKSPKTKIDNKTQIPGQPTEFPTTRG